MYSKRWKVVEQRQDLSPCEESKVFPSVITPFSTLVNFDPNILILIDEYLPTLEKLRNTHTHWFLAHGLVKHLIQVCKSQWRIYETASNAAFYSCSPQELKTCMNIEGMQIPILRKIQSNIGIFEDLRIKNNRLFAELLPLVTNKRLLREFVLSSRFRLNDESYHFILDNVVLKKTEKRKLIKSNIQSGRPDRIPIHLYPMLPDCEMGSEFCDFMSNMYQCANYHDTLGLRKVKEAIVRITNLVLWYQA